MTPDKDITHDLGRTQGSGEASRAPSRRPIPESGHREEAGEISLTGGWLQVLCQVAVAPARQAHVPRLRWET